MPYLGNYYYLFQDPLVYDYLFTDAIKLHRRNAILWRIEAPLRCLKLSFGFVNSVLLIVMIKPFQDPIVACFKRIQESLSGKEPQK